MNSGVGVGTVRWLLGHRNLQTTQMSFEYVQIAMKAGEPRTALDAVKKYLATAGKEGQFYQAQSKGGV